MGGTEGSLIGGKGLQIGGQGSLPTFGNPSHIGQPWVMALRQLYLFLFQVKNTKWELMRINKVAQRIMISTYELILCNDELLMRMFPKTTLFPRLILCFTQD